MTRGKVKVLWALLLIILPLTLWITHHFYIVNIEGQHIEILYFLGLAFVVSLFPITTDKHTVFFVNGVNVVVFLIFGLFVEIIFAQLSLIIVVVKTGIFKKESYRLPLNMLAFLFMSVISAEVFYALGGQHGFVYQKFYEFLPAIFYAFTMFIANQLINKLANVFLHKRKVRIFDRRFTWEFMTLWLTLLVGFILYVLYFYLGKIGIVFVGIPFISVIIILNVLYSYQEVNFYLKESGKIGHQLTISLDTETIYREFVENVIRLLPVDYVYIYSVVDNERLELVHFCDVYRGKKAPFRYMHPNQGFSGVVWTSKKPILFCHSGEWISYNSPKIPKHTESVLSLPIEYGPSTIGVVTLISKRKNAFEKSHFHFLKIITNHLGVAIENAEIVKREKEKGEKDGLTGLYNYKYFIQKLNGYFEMINMEDNQLEKDSLSLLLLDLDHFKGINDNYGHEAGNQVLYEVAKRLNKITKGLGILARYGGEEFILLLPRKKTSEAFGLAEKIRILIAEKPFKVRSEFLAMGDHSEVQIKVTVSIGVSSYPVDCETPSELVRCADQAMYAGAKNKGRNRVATYQKTI